MKRTKVFIVGAGASREFSLPTGRELVEQIERITAVKEQDFGRRFVSDTVLRYAVRNAFSVFEGVTEEAIIDELSPIRQNMGLAPSIDNFLEARKDNPASSAAGKLAIAKCILDAERNSPLWFDTSNFYNLPQFFDLPQNWLSEVFRTLVAQKGIDEFFEALSTCRFVTFNYDRVIEQFFHQAIKSYFSLESAKVDERCEEALNVIHVYGSLGDIDCKNVRRFGCSDDADYLVKAAAGIKTFSEGVADPTRIDEAKHWIRTSDVVLFLGFSMLPLNLRALAPVSTERYPQQRVLGTSLGIPESNLDIAKTVLRHEWYFRGHQNLEFSACKGSELIADYSYFLSEFDLP